MLQCTGFTLGSLQFSERVLWESFNTSYFEASPRPKVPGGSYTSGLIRCLAARKPFCPADRSPPMSTYHTAARAWARWTIDAESMRGSEAPTPSRRCRRSWTIGDRFSRSAENRIGRPPRRYGCRAELKKKSGLQGLAGEVLTIYRRGCFVTRLSRLAVAVHRPVRLFSYAFVHRPKCLFSYAFVSIKKSHRLNFFVSLEALRR